MPWSSYVLSEYESGGETERHENVTNQIGPRSDEEPRESLFCRCGRRCFQTARSRMDRGTPWRQEDPP